MQYIEALLTGEIGMATFVAEMKSNSALQEQLRELIPHEAGTDPDNSLWKKYSYYALKAKSFDFLEHLLKLHRFDGTIGDNLNIFGSICTVYTHFHPNIQCTDVYEEMYDLYLDVAADCFEGPECSSVLEKIIVDAFAEKTKKGRKAKAKEAIRSIFYYEGKKRPYWIQGAEWPMGMCNPMKFMSQKSCGEYVEFYFLDMDTGEMKTVRQDY